MRKLVVALVLLFGVAFFANSIVDGVRKANAPPPPPAVPTVPDGPSIPHAFTVVPANANHTPAEKLVDADKLVARWKSWKARPTEEIIPFSDYHNARANLTSIKQTDPEYQAALKKAEELDTFGVELSNEEIKRAEKIRARERAKAELALFNDVDGRKRYASEVEKIFLRASMDARVTLEGEKGTTLKIKYVLFSRPLIFNMQEKGQVIPDLIQGAQLRGFRKLVLTDGYDHEWSWNLGKKG